MLGFQLKRKLTVIGLLCLFIWNVALAAIPSILVCLHSAIELHIEPALTDVDHCEDLHFHDMASAECAVDDDCTDIELIGGALIPTRVNETTLSFLPIFDVASFQYVDAAVLPTHVESMRLPFLRAPPSIHWLTDTYLSKTVLRI